jgi:signal peptidase I
MNPPPVVPREPWYRFAAEVALIIVVLSFLTGWLVQTYIIPTPSMEPTLMAGDHLLVDKLSYAPHGSVAGAVLPFGDVQRGDIILFRWPVKAEQTFVKRVIGVPGDRIRLNEKAVLLNGEPLSEPYARYRPGADSYRDNFPAVDPFPGVPEQTLDMFERQVKNGEVVVPDRSYFVMGDNRDLSMDSRFWGFVPKENIVGKPILVYWSFASQTRRTDSGPSLTYLFEIFTGFFTKTRWDRTGRLVRGHPLRPAAKR